MSFPEVSSQAIPDLGTDEAVAITIDRMRTLAHADARASIVPAYAADIMRTKQPSSTKEYAELCYAFTQGWMRFKADEIHAWERLGRNGDNIEYLQSPAYLLSVERPEGDCDCYSMLLASLLLAGGVPCAFVTIAANEQTPNNFSHVYVCAYVPGERLALDASHGSYPGWEYPNIYRIQEWSL